MNGHYRKYFSVDISFLQLFSHKVKGAHDIKCSQK